MTNILTEKQLNVRSRLFIVVLDPQCVWPETKLFGPFLLFCLVPTINAVLIKKPPFLKWLVKSQSLENNKLANIYRRTWFKDFVRLLVSCQQFACLTLRWLWKFVHWNFWSLVWVHPRNLKFKITLFRIGYEEDITF